MYITLSNGVQEQVRFLRVIYVRFKLVVHQYPGGEGRGLSLFFRKNIVINRGRGKLNSDKLPGSPGSRKNFLKI